jgi:hypothetical protein
MKLSHLISLYGWAGKNHPSAALDGALKIDNPDNRKVVSFSKAVEAAESLIVKLEAFARPQDIRQSAADVYRGPVIDRVVHVGVEFTIEHQLDIRVPGVPAALI